MSDKDEDVIESGTAGTLIQAIEDGDTEAMYAMFEDGGNPLDLLDGKDKESVDGEEKAGNTEPEPTTETKPTTEAKPAEEPEPSLSDAPAAEPASEPTVEPTEPQGIQSKNGEGLIPYSELEAARNDAKAKGEMLDQLQTQLSEREGADQELLQKMDELKRKVDVYEAQLADNDLTPHDLPENFKISDELREELKGFGTLGETMVKLYDSFQARAGSVADKAAPAAETASPEPEPAVEAKPQTAEEAAAAIVQGDADLTRWNETAVAWNVVKATDAEVSALPEFKGKSLSERLPRVKELVKQRLGEAAATPTPTQEQGAQPTIEEAPPSSLTEIVGQDAGTLLTDKERVEQASSSVEAAHIMEEALKKGKPVESFLDL